MALLDRVNHHAETRPEAVAYRIPSGASLTYRQLADRIAALSGWLADQLNPGDVVMLSCPSQLEYPIAFLAILAAGCTVFPVSAEAADAELSRAAAESGAVAVIGDNRAVGLLHTLVSFTVSMEMVRGADPTGDEDTGGPPVPLSSIG